MTIFDANEKIEFLATQSLHYDRYIDCQCFLERVDVNGKYGLVCREESDEYGNHSKVKPDLANLQAPVLGNYAEKDRSGPPDKVHELEQQLKALGKQVDFKIYPGTDHAFFNDTRPEVYNAQAAADAWQRTIQFLRPR